MRTITFVKASAAALSGDRSISMIWKAPCASSAIGVALIVASDIPVTVEPPGAVKPVQSACEHTEDRDVGNGAGTGAVGGGKVDRAAADGVRELDRVTLEEVHRVRRSDGEGASEALASNGAAGADEAKGR